jgi:DNA (cytosine-5)-methyltransferase 1
MRLRPVSDDRINVDLFAGGGGAGEGKRRATGRSPHVAVNHWPVAVAMYKANHPNAHTLIEDVRDVKPLEATGGRLVRGLWASPTCIYFSRASGQRLSPETIAIRALADIVFPWIDDTQPEWVIVENVPEFQGWGPVCLKHADGCAGALDESGKTCSDACEYGRPIKERRGELFNAWRAKFIARGYSFDMRTLTAWEYGAPTTRPRLYCVARRDGKAFAWPKPTHCRPELVEKTGLKPWRTAAGIIDWSIPCPSIFERAKPHVDATRRRLAKGMRKFVLETSKPFLLHLTHGDRHAPHSIDEPTPTVTGANRGEQAIAVPYMIHHGNGERPGQEPRTYDVREPHPTVVAGGVKARPVVAFLAKAYSERETGGWNGGASLEQPFSTVTAQDHHHLVAVHATKFYGTSTGASVDEPMHTITAAARADGSNRGTGGHIGVVAASLLRYHGERRSGEDARGQSLEAPVSTLDSSNRLAIAEYATAGAPEWNEVIAAKARRVYRFLVDEGIDGAWLDHERQLVRLPACPELVIYDIGMRMLVPRELFRANGFDDSYQIELIGPRGKPLTKTEQVRLVGNSVSPNVAEALVRAAIAMGTPSKRRRVRNDNAPQMALALEAA